MSIITRAEVQTLVPKLNDPSYDALIDFNIPVVEEFIQTYCNNCFTYYEAGRRDEYTYFSDNELTFDGTGNTITDNSSTINFVTEHKLKVGNDLYIKGSLENDGSYEILTVTDTVITVTDLYDIEDEVTDDTQYPIYFLKVRWPKELKLVAAQMIAYNTLYKYKGNGNVKSESIDNYSVSFTTPNESSKDKNNSYPSEIMDSLAFYRIVSMQ